MGKTVTSYPPTRGENSLESIKGAEVPQRFIFGLCIGKMKPGSGQEKQAAASIRGLSYVSCQQRGCSCAYSVPDGQLALESVSLIKSTGLQASRPWFGVMTRCKLGRGGEHGWLQAQLCQEFPVLSWVSRFPLWASDLLCQPNENQHSSAFHSNSLGMRGK